MVCLNANELFIVETIYRQQNKLNKWPIIETEVSIKTKNKNIFKYEYCGCLDDWLSFIFYTSIESLAITLNYFLAIFLSFKWSLNYACSEFVSVLQH